MQGHTYTHRANYEKNQRRENLEGNGRKGIFMQGSKDEYYSRHLLRNNASQGVNGAIVLRLREKPKNLSVNFYTQLKISFKNRAESRLFQTNKQPKKVDRIQTRRPTHQEIPRESSSGKRRRILDGNLNLAKDEAL